MFFADDLTLLAYSVLGAQALVDESVLFFQEKGLEPNPTKCEFMVFGTQVGSRAAWNVQGTSREQQDMARYLGLHFQSNGKWDLQLQLAASKARSALGRCKIIMSTVGKGNVRLALGFFESLVSSVYRFGLGVCGVTVAKISTLDTIFVDYIRWIFRLPRTTGANIILSNFAQRCAKCDSLFLAATQIAGAVSSRNSTWQRTVRDLLDGRLQSTWFTATMAELAKRGMVQEVLQYGADFVANRKIYGVQFSQYCFVNHTNVPTGSSSDLFRRHRPFGIYPFLLKTPSHSSRFLFSFVASAWRFIDGAVCESYPQYCSTCDCENSAFHVLFDCHLFEAERMIFLARTGQPFSFSSLQSECLVVCREIVSVAKCIYFKVREKCGER
jgi:hypothetical protein